MQARNLEASSMIPMGFDYMCQKNDGTERSNKQALKSKHNSLTNRIAPRRYRGLVLQDCFVPGKWVRCISRQKDRQCCFGALSRNATIGIVIDFSRALISDQRTG